MIQEYKYKCINYLKNKCNKSKYTNKILGTHIRGLHIGGFQYTWLIALYCPKKFLLSIIIILCILLFHFYLFNGCFLTKLEQYLCDDKYTLMDFYVEYFNLELNNKNRMFISYSIGVPYLFILFFIYYYRFIK